MLKSLQSETGFAVCARRMRRAWESAQRAAMRGVEPLAIAAIMFLLTRAEILMRASPLAVAGLCAVAVSGRSAAAAVAGCLLGALRLPLSGISLLPVIACAMALGVEFVLSLIPMAGKIDAETRASAVAGFACLPRGRSSGCGRRTGGSVPAVSRGRFSRGGAGGTGIARRRAHVRVSPGSGRCESLRGSHTCNDVGRRAL